MRTIEAEIIPRLMMAHGDASAPPPPATPVPLPTAREVDQFAGMMLGPTVAPARDYATVLLAAGMPLESLFLDLLAPAARLLGDLWLADLCTFAKVTLGLSRLQQLVLEFSSREPPDRAEEPNRIVVLAPAPGEQHSLGLHMVAHLFHQAGWAPRIEHSSKEEDLAALLRRERVDMIGFSVSNEHLVEPLGGLIRAVRTASANPDMVVMLGGSLEVDDSYVEAVGADTYVSSGRDAVKYMERHITRAASRPVN